MLKQPKDRVKYSAGLYRMQADGSEDELTRSTATVNDLPSLAIQSERDSADINVLVKRFGITGEIPVSQRSMFYGDFSEVTDFQSALNQLRAAQEGFMELPASLRERFNNDPGRLVEFVQDKSNREEAVKLGIMKAPPPAPKPAEPVLVRIAPETPPTS